MLILILFQLTNSLLKFTIQTISEMCLLDFFDDGDNNCMCLIKNKLSLIRKHVLLLLSSLIVFLRVVLQYVVLQR